MVVALHIRYLLVHLVFTASGPGVAEQACFLLRLACKSNMSMVTRHVCIIAVQFYPALQ